jgi:arylsulfatase A-like enzyme
MNSRVMVFAALIFWVGCIQSEDPEPEESGVPNFVVIFCDDLGYGDIGPFGHPTIRTPALDRMAAEGQKWTSFYVGASVCTPSRAALMTGRLPIRSGMCSDVRRVLFPDSGGGLPAEEITIAEALKQLGYATACVGKWHLGHLPQFLPAANGFDHYFGIPYSNDMDRVAEAPKGRAAFLKPEVEYWDVPLLRNTEVIERPADQRTITRRYTEEAVDFILKYRDQPFFLYLAHSMPHVPLFRSDPFVETSRRGLFGDVIEEIDWSVGRVLQILRELELDRKTLVVFSSDNGPWLTFDQQGGSAGLLRGGKGGTFEGGMREPTLFWWPGRVEPGIVADMATTMDLLPTFLDLAEAEVPSDRVLDGYSLKPALQSEGILERDSVIYYRGTEIYAVRKGPYKAHFVTRSEYGGEDPVYHDPPLLYHLEHDPSEKYDLAEDHPDVIAGIQALVREHKSTVQPVPDQLAIRLE